jgi:hypothetical protein
VVYFCETARLHSLYRCCQLLTVFDYLRHRKRTQWNVCFKGWLNLGETLQINMACGAGSRTARA